MKKKTVIITALILVFLLLLGLFISSQYKKRQQEALAAGKDAVIVSHDKTAFPDFIYNTDSISLESIVGEKHYSFDFSEQDNPESVIERSSDVLRGRIENISFTFINGRSWTAADLHVLEVYKGELLADDVISLYYPGGYVSVNDYNSCYEPDKSGSDTEFYQSVVDLAPFPFILEEDIFFLSSDTEAFKLPEGSYILSCGNSSVCSIIDSEKMLWLGKELSSDEIINMLK